MKSSGFILILVIPGFVIVCARTGVKSLLSLMCILFESVGQAVA